MNVSNKHPFIKNVLTLMSGTTLAQLLTILASPFLSRIFSPEDFALLASFTSVTSLCMVFCSGKYERAILLPENEEDARSIFRLSVMLSVLISLCLPLLILFVARFNQAFSVLVESNLVLITVTFVFCGNICEIFRLYFLRHKLFKAISSRTVLISLTTVGLNLICGYFIYSHKVLVTSTTVAQIAALILFVVLFFKFFGNEKYQFSFRSIKKSLIEYWQFPTFIMTGQILNSVTGNTPILVLSDSFSSYEIGMYAFVNKIVNVPITVVVSAVSQVFLQKITQTQRDKHLELYLKTAGTLFAVIIFPSVLCVIFAPLLFKVIFGETWIAAASLAQLLTPMFIIRFALSPLEGAAFTVRGKNYFSFIMQVLRFVCVIVAVVLALNLNLSFQMTIFSYSVGLIVFYVGYFVWEICLLVGEQILLKRGDISA